MARQTETFEIDGKRFRHKQLGAVQGRRILSLLIPVVAPALEHLDMKDIKSVGDIKGDKLLTLMSHVIGSLTP
jgi:hypothetical protein